MARRRRLQAIGAFSALAVLAACSTYGDSTSSAGKPSAPSVPGGSIVYDGEPSSDDALLEVRLDDGKVTVIGDGATGVGARFSPGGERLAYTRPSATEGELAEVLVLDVEAGTETSVGPGGCPTWTTDGEGLVVSLEDGLHRLELAGGRELLDPDPEICGIEVGDAQYVLWGQDHTLEFMDGSAKETLVDTPGCGIGPVDVDGPRGRIAYTVACDAADGPGGLWVLDLASRAAAQIADDVAYGASWSPDGRWIATTLGVELDDGSWRYDLWVVGVVGDQRQWVAVGDAGQPTWRPSA